MAANLTDRACVPLSELRVDRKELPQVGEEAPAEAGFGLVLVVHSLAVSRCLPDETAIWIEEDTVAVGGHDTSRHVGCQPFGKLQALPKDAKPVMAVVRRRSMVCRLRGTRSGD